MGLSVSDTVRAVYARAEAMRRAFPGWVVAVQTFDQGRPRIEVVNREGHDPWVMISSDVGELWAELDRVNPRVSQQGRK